jgi:hypothetical protein
LIPTAGILTLLLLAGLTTIAFTTRQDFSFSHVVIIPPLNDPKKGDLIVG